MLIPEHVARVKSLALSWDRAVHEELGYFPDAFRETIRAHLAGYLRVLAEELQRDLSAVQEAQTALAIASENICA